MQEGRVTVEADGIIVVELSDAIPIGRVQTKILHLKARMNGGDLIEARKREVRLSEGLDIGEAGVFAMASVAVGCTINDILSVSLADVSTLAEAVGLLFERQVADPKAGAGEPSPKE